VTSSLTVGSGPPIPARSGESLLDLDNRVGVDLDFGCRGGNCGTCIIRVISGLEYLPPRSPFEESLIPDLVDLPPDNLRLACQLRLFGPVHVERYEL